MRCDGILRRNPLRPVIKYRRTTDLAWFPLTTMDCCNYKETQIEYIKPGQKAEIKVDTFSRQSIEGTVQSIMAGTVPYFPCFRQRMRRVIM